MRTLARAALLLFLPASIAFAQGREMETADARRILSLARDAARQVQGDRETLITNLSSAMAATGDLWGAFETITLLPESQRNCAIWPIAWNQADAGDFSGALFTLASIRDPACRHHVLMEISRMQAEAGNFGRAQATAALLPDLYGRTQAFIRIARIRSNSGDRSAGRALLREAFQAVPRRGETPPSDGIRPSLAEPLALIAAAQHDLGDNAGFQETLEALRRVIEAEENLDRSLAQIGLVRAYAETGAMGAALQAAQEIPAGHQRDRALGLIAESQVRGGNLPGGLETLAGIREKEIRILTLRQMAHLQAEAGDLTGAIQTTELISDLSRRAEVLLSLAWVQAGNERAASALAALDRALEAGEAAGKTGMDDRFWNGVAFVYAATGQIGPALETAHAIRSPNERADALGRVAHAQAEAGDWRGALGWAMQEESALDRAEALMSIGWAFIHRWRAQEKK